VVGVVWWEWKKVRPDLGRGFLFFGATARSAHLSDSWRFLFLLIPEKTKEVVAAEIAALAGAGVCEEGSRQDAGATKNDKQKTGWGRGVEAI
jgi:hypothetical protein